MDIFLIAKQLVDILHEFKILDYAILIFAFSLFLYKFISAKKYNNLLKNIIVPDFLIIVLMFIYTVTFIRCPENSYNQYVKTMSAFSVYFLGRVFGEEIVSRTKVIAFFSYLVIYINFIFRLFEKYCGVRIPVQQWEYKASGGLYFYKTDLLIGITVATIFVYGFAKNTVFKYFTIFVVTALVGFDNTARMGQMILLVEYIFIIFIEGRKYMQKKWNINVSIRRKNYKLLSVTILVLITVVLILIQTLPIHSVLFENLDVSDKLAYKLENAFHSRHVIWWDAMNYFSNQSFITRLIGIDLWSEILRNTLNDRFHCLYFKLLYSVGYLGVYTFSIFLIFLYMSISEKKDFLLKYMTVAFWIMFLLIGISMEAFEYTQMSWYPFIFAGAIMNGMSIGDVFKKHEENK